MARGHVPGQLGLFAPETTWRAPTELPDLRGRRVVALDTEYKDDGILHGRGAGWALGPAGYLCGVSWATEGSSGYAPVRHPADPRYSCDLFDQAAVLRWVSDLHASDARVVYHNGPYDVGWLSALGITPPAHLDDTLAACVMDDESADTGFSLDACCARYGVPGKDKAVLVEAVRAFGGDPRKPAGDLWRVPALLAGEYAEADAVATLALWRQVEPRLEAQGVTTAYQLETDLIPVFVAMRKRGVRIDMAASVRLRVEFYARRDAMLRQVKDAAAYRREVTIEDVRSPQWMTARCRELSISYPMTSGGTKGAAAARGSFTDDWMPRHPHAFPRAVSLALKFDMAASKFIETFILGFSHRGRLHAELHQFLSDEGGTRSHRISIGNPPLQQMFRPAKDDDGSVTADDMETKHIGGAIRRLFLPEEGGYWASPDFASQEPRFTVHYASLCGCRGAEVAVQRYRDEPRTDYHKMVAEMVNRPRDVAKILNLAMTYGKGERSTAAELGLSLEDGRAVIADYHDRLPFIRPLDERCRSDAARRGYIRLVDGARIHYNHWDAGWLDEDDRRAAMRAGLRLDPCSLAEAQVRQRDAAHPWRGRRLRRADVRKALNNLIQGSAARQTKISMREMHRAGLIMMLQMHDEVPHTAWCEADVRLAERIMIESVPLVVPVVVDAEVGPTWGDAKLSWRQCVEKYGEPAGRRMAA